MPALLLCGETDQPALMIWILTWTILPSALTLMSSINWLIWLRARPVLSLKNTTASYRASVAEPELYQSFIDAGESIASLFEQRDFARAIREIMTLADQANKYIDDKAPWALAKQEGKEVEVQDICSMGINLFRVLMTYLKPDYAETGRA